MQFSAFYYATHFIGAGVGHLLSESGGLLTLYQYWDSCKNAKTVLTPLSAFYLFLYNSNFGNLLLTSHGYNTSQCWHHRGKLNACEVSSDIDFLFSPHFSIVDFRRLLSNPYVFLMQRYIFFFISTKSLLKNFYSFMAIPS